MSTITIMVLIGAATFVLSISSSMFIVGIKWGTMAATMATISERLAKIEGMFEMKLKD